MGDLEPYAGTCRNSSAALRPKRDIDSRSRRCGIGLVFRHCRPRNFDCYGKFSNRLEVAGQSSANTMDRTEQGVSLISHSAVRPNCNATSRVRIAGRQLEMAAGFEPSASLLAETTRLLGLLIQARSVPIEPPALVGRGRVRCSRPETLAAVAQRTHEPDQLLALH